MSKYEGRETRNKGLRYAFIRQVGGRIYDIKAPVVVLSGQPPTTLEIFETEYGAVDAMGIFCTAVRALSESGEVLSMNELDIPFKVEHVLANGTPVVLQYHPRGKNDAPWLAERDARTAANEVRRINAGSSKSPAHSLEQRAQ